MGLRNPWKQFQNQMHFQTHAISSPSAREGAPLRAAARSNPIHHTPVAPHAANPDHLSNNPAIGMSSSRESALKAALAPWCQPEKVNISPVERDWCNTFPIQCFVDTFSEVFRPIGKRPWANFSWEESSHYESILGERPLSATVWPITSLEDTWILRDKYKGIPFGGAYRPIVSSLRKWCKERTRKGRDEREERKEKREEWERKRKGWDKEKERKRKGREENFARGIVNSTLASVIQRHFCKSILFCL